ncbi:MAG: DUF1684 domain-containing protein [Acidobacteria bacterium]|uniref:DUF1684 domain-containing protein n=1 Tax=Candidatus Polarisedimenticola svalbardensis TaxID=2886004 RepID=A0A8J6Y1X5_9BACT|nr:DUF1684 domain-containing protein [Candidatus Polarisedimenticola svalbardensis]
MILFRRSTCLLVFLAVTACVLYGCSGSGGGEMVVEPAAAGWEENLLSYRASKDVNYATAPDTPVHPDDRAAFGGLAYFPPDPAYRLVGPMHPHETREQFTILSTTGKSRPAERYGEMRFTLMGEHLVLQVYRLLDSKAPTPVQELFVPFTDRTSGVESYPAGRYVDLSETGDGRYILDFNRAFNPLCAYGMPEKYACPVTPAENRLKIRVEAGEQGYRRG